MAVGHAVGEGGTRGGKEPLFSWRILTIWVQAAACLGHVVPRGVWCAVVHDCRVCGISTVAAAYSQTQLPPPIPHPSCTPSSPLRRTRVAYIVPAWCVYLYWCYLNPTQVQASMQVQCRDITEHASLINAMFTLVPPCGPCTSPQMGKVESTYCY